MGYRKVGWLEQLRYVIRGKIFGWRRKRCRLCYDYLIADDLVDLACMLHTINASGYQLVSVTQDPIGVYTIFFGRWEM